MSKRQRERQRKRAVRQREKSRRQKQRQKAKTSRQDKRVTGRTQRKMQRSRRVEARQSSRSQRQQVRQENRTRRAEGRQAVRMTKVEAKRDSGFYTPEGVAARRQGTANIIGASGQVVGDLAPLIAGIATGGASIGATEGLGALAGMAGNLTGIAGETGLQGFGGAVGLGGDPPIPNEDFEVDTKSGFDFSFSNPVVLGGLALSGLGLFLALRPKKKKRG